MKRVFAAVFAYCLLASATASATVPASMSLQSIHSVVDATISALMAKDDIPGMAVGVVANGTPYVFEYGMASLSSRTLVSDRTLFEIGSVSKTFTATLVSLAQVRGKLSLNDTTARYLPELRGTPFGNVRLLSLGTHFPGGLPLQFPDAVVTQSDVMAYFKQWHPAYPQGTYRTYANPGIAMLGYIAAIGMGNDFRSLLQRQLLPALGLRHTFIAIPQDEAEHYAWGYDDGDKPIRMKSGALSDEAYGIRTTASDMTRFVQDNIDAAALSPDVAKAVVQTHTGYFQAGPMTQDLIWEQYPYPVSLEALRAGNSVNMIFDATPVRAIVPPQAPRADVWIDKTGSTNGFATYVAFVPSKRTGVVLLANKDYAISDRVSAAYAIARALLAAP